jgi:hypothetical protein
MTYLFVTLTFDYADEFNVHCCFVQKAEEFNADMAAIEQLFKENPGMSNEEFYFGTNEFLQFSDFEDFESGVEAQDCSEQFYNEFKRLNNGSIGFNVIDSLLEID